MPSWNDLINNIQNLGNDVQGIDNFLNSTINKSLNAVSA